MGAFNAERNLKSGSPGSPDHSPITGMPPPKTGTDQAVGAGH
jgi:hypothetical protein